MSKYVTRDLVKAISLIFAVFFYLFALYVALLSSSFSGVFGGGLFGATPDLWDYIPIALVAVSLPVIGFYFRRYQAIPVWISAGLIVASAYHLP